MMQQSEAISDCYFSARKAFLIAFPLLVASCGNDKTGKSFGAKMAEHFGVVALAVFGTMNYGPCRRFRNPLWANSPPILGDQFSYQFFIPAESTRP